VKLGPGEVNLIRNSIASTSRSVERDSLTFPTANNKYKCLSSIGFFDYISTRMHLFRHVIEDFCFK